MTTYFRLSGDYLKEEILKELLADIKTDDIPPAHIPIIDLIGMDAFVKLCDYSNGDKLYFPMVKTIIKNVRNRKIILEYNGYNARELASKYDITICQLKKII